MKHIKQPLSQEPIRLLIAQLLQELYHYAWTMDGKKKHCYIHACVMNIFFCSQPALTVKTHFYRTKMRIRYLDQRGATDWAKKIG